MKKQYKSVDYKNSASGHAIVMLDNAPALTPLGKSLLLPNMGLAHAIGEEWRAQEKTIRKDTMPLTQIACLAIDLVGEKRSEVCEEMLAYGETDLICYRAGNIPVLQQRQDAVFNPVIAWAEHRLRIVLAVTDGVMPAKQPEANLLTLRSFLSDYDDWKLAVVAATTKSLGSLILALALTEKYLSAQDTFDASYLEESYETQQWGEDDEKQARMQKLRQEILAAGRFLSLL